MSPLTLKLPLSKSLSTREYRACTRYFKKSLLDSTSDLEIFTTLFLNSLGFPIPYKHETDAITMTSFLPESSDDTVLSLSFSISSLIDRSFSI